MNELFEVGPRTPLPRKTCTPAPIGSGPAGETCASCYFYHRAIYRNTPYIKCWKTRQAWTHGAGSDIRAKWAACRYGDAHFYRADMIAVDTVTILSAIGTFGASLKYPEFPRVTKAEWRVFADFLEERCDRDCEKARSVAMLLDHLPEVRQ